MSTKTILIIDDEPDLLDLMREILEMHGHTVSGAASREQAHLEWDKSNGQFELLVTDLSLPKGNSGVALAAEFKTRRADLKVLYTSGHEREMVMEKFQMPADAAFLKKPFNPAALAKAVEML